MLAFLTSRFVILGVGLSLAAAFIWYAGELFAFGDYRPLESQTARIVLIALVVVGCLAAQWLKKRAAAKKTDQLMAGVAGQAAAEPTSPELTRLREQFADAVATLKQKGRGSRALYDLPWYAIIGAPGSGKTTALVNSGLHFPLEQRVGRGALRGVGGTRNCDWWFTDEAIFLDTAGRYTTQDSDEAADSTAWREFLALLRKYRPRRPLNGLIVAVSAQDLMLEGQVEREAHVAAVRRRLDELNRELRVQLPVYLMVTKCDLVSGFMEYFDDLTAEGRAQVWGVTFPHQQTVSSEAPKQWPAEFEALVTRLNERVFVRVEEERDPRRRTALFGFPQQMGALRDVLAEFVAEVFSATRFDRQTLLRGVYFTSGTQEGTPIDRLLGALSRRFGMAQEAVSPPPGKGKAFFIERLLKDVLIAESGLAGLNRRHEATQAALQLAAYAALIALTILGVAAMWISYGNNKAFVAEVQAAAGELEKVPASPAGAPLDRVLPRLDAVRRVSETANQYRDDVPVMTMTAGLFQGRSLGTTAADAYARELNGALLPALQTRFEQRLREYAADPELLLVYLKGYLMLGGRPAEAPASGLEQDRKDLELLANREWQEVYASDPQAAKRLADHFSQLLELEGARARDLDQALIAQVRSSIRQASLPRLLYGHLQAQYGPSTPGGVRLDEAAGVGADVFRRKSGRSLAEPVAPLYTKAVFETISQQNVAELVKSLTADRWVWGDERMATADDGRIAPELLALYERDYIAAWDAVLSDLTLAPTPTLERTKEVLGKLGHRTSPLMGILKRVDEQTFLVKPPEPTAQSPSLTSRVQSLIVSGPKAPAAAAPPGQQITTHFDWLHRLVSGESGATPLDGVLEQIRQVEQRLAPVGPQVGGTPLDDPAAMAAITQSANSLKREAATLPAAVGAVVSQLADRTASVSSAGLRGTLANRYRQSVLRECVALVNGRYPFSPGGPDITVADFGRLFGYGGVFDSFFKNELEPLVDVTRTPWSWREGAEGAAVPLRTFHAAESIRRMFFRDGAQLPEVTFTLRPVELDQGSRRFVMELHGEMFEYGHGAVRDKTVSWPGKMALAAARFEEPSGARANMVYDGAWGWFKLLDAVQRRQESDTRFQLTFATGGHQARVQMDAERVSNPFAQAELERFRCE